MREFLRSWGARGARRWRWALYFALYKLAEDRALEWANDRIDEGVGGSMGALDRVVDNLATITWVAIPIVIIVLVFATWIATRNQEAAAESTQTSTAADSPDPENGPAFADYKDRAGYWSTMATNDRDVLAARVFVHDRAINFAHLAKKTLGQSCYLDFSFDLVNSSVFTVNIGRQIHGNLIIDVADYPLWGSQPMEAKLKYMPRNSTESEITGLILRHAERGRLTVRQPLTEAVARDIWLNLAGKRARFVFREVTIVLEAVSPDGQVIPAQALQLPRELEYAIPFHDELGQWLPS